MDNNNFLNFINYQLGLLLNLQVDDDDDDDDDDDGSGRRDSDDEDDLMMYPERLDLSSFDEARGAHAGDYCDGFDLGDD